MSTDSKYWGFGGGKLAAAEVDQEDADGADRDRTRQKKAQADAAQLKRITAITAASKEYKTKLEDLTIAHGSEEEKLAILNRRWLEEAEAVKASKDEVERYKHAIAAAGIGSEIDQALQRREKDRQEALDKQNQALEKQADALRAISDAEGKRTQAAQELANAHAERSKFTLHDLASMGADRATTGDMRRQIWQARQITMAEQWARNLAAHGYAGQSQEVFNRADQMRAGLSALTEQERNPFHALQKNLESADKGINELVRKASNEGLLIVPTNGQ